MNVAHLCPHPNLPNRVRAIIKYADMRALTINYGIVHQATTGIGTEQRTILRTLDHPTDAQKTLAPD